MWRKQVIEMVRELGDRMRFEDDCLLISYDKNAWSKSNSAQLSRAAPYLETTVIESWNKDSESLLDHLFSLHQQMKNYYAYRIS